MSQISQSTGFRSLVLPEPVTDAQQLLAEFRVPEQFANASIENYMPDPEHPSQELAATRVAEFAQRASRPQKKRLFKKVEPATGVYLDGGFGVGKTHLLAAMAHEVGDDKSMFGSFVAYTHLVGALGFSRSVQALSNYRLLCIDEFELDDPGDTVLMSRLIREVSDRGVWLAATSNTLPESLGEGRFAAEDFLREIQALSQRFTIYRIEGKDYRARNTDLSEQLPQAYSADLSKTGATLVTYEELLGILQQVHPSSYGKLIAGIEHLIIDGLSPMPDQNMALRFVSFVDRLYDYQVRVLCTAGQLETLAELYPVAMLNGGYRKKYLRSLSRLSALLQT